MVNFRQVQSRLANNPVLREREGCLSACFKSVQSARGLMHWQVDKYAHDTQKRLNVQGLTATGIAQFRRARKQTRVPCDACCMTITSERMLHKDAKPRVLHSTAMDPWPDLAHFACLLGSTVHILC